MSDNGFRNRVVQAAEGALEELGSVGPLELLHYMGFLHRVHLEAWRKGNPHFRVLEEHFQVGPAKFARTLRYFDEWVKSRGLQPIEASYTRRAPEGIEQLQVTAGPDPEREKFFRTHYAPADLPKKKVERLETRLNKAPDLVVFEKVGDAGECAECGGELSESSYLVLEKEQPLCLACADLDHLVFLPAGDTALTRRARKHSTLAAVVVRFNRRFKRYQRQGLLVTDEAITRAEKECAADASDRAVARVRSAEARKEEDREFIRTFTDAILESYPNCPQKEALEIAEHTALRGSGRVGRSAAARRLDPRAVDLAVIAHIRHAHTGYDKLLMTGVERLEARMLVRQKIDSVLDKWRRA